MVILKKDKRTLTIHSNEDINNRFRNTYHTWLTYVAKATNTRQYDFVIHLLDLFDIELKEMEEKKKNAAARTMD